MIQTPRPSSFFEELSMQPIPREVVWLVSFVLIEAAIIDGRSLRVPNWLTFHFLIGGLVFAFMRGGSPLLLSSLAGASWACSRCCRCIRSAVWARVT